MSGLGADPATGHPFMDYVFNVQSTGYYTITLISPNAEAYDPLLQLIQNGVQIAEDDDSAGYPSSRITRQLMPGSYVVRVTSYRANVPAPSPFTLSVTGG